MSSRAARYKARYQINAELAIPKPMRRRDEAVLQEARDRGRCEWPGCRETGWPIDPAHIKSRGSGGDDVAANVVTLCRFHHNEHHAGRIKRWQLELIVAARRLRASH